VTAPAVHSPAQLPDLRLWLADQWAPGQPFHASAAPYHATRARSLLGLGASAQLAAAYASYERTTLLGAGLWWVAEPMVDLLLAAAAAVPDDATMADLPPMPAMGLVVFAKPWLGKDGNRPTHLVTVNAFTWGAVALPSATGGERRLACTISTYRALDFAQGLSPDELGLATATGAMNHATMHPLPATAELDRVAASLRERAASPEVAERLADGEAMAASSGEHPEWGTLSMASDGQAHRALGRTWVPLGRSDWPVGDAIGADPWAGATDPVALASMVEDRQVLSALWTLLHQEGIAQQTSHRPERQAVRRTQRAGVDPKLATVQVVTLRRLHRTDSAPSDDHATREWTHRWLVAGHWRWQPCGPGRRERRLTYVRPHVKGPEDKPLRVPERVNAWTR
jgi:hypothetical protein